MVSWLIPVCVAVVAFLITLNVLPKSRAASTKNRKEELLGEIERTTRETQASAAASMEAVTAHDYTMADAVSELSPIGQALVRLPMGLSLYTKMVQAGMRSNASSLVVFAVIGAVIISFLASKPFGLLGLLAGPAAGFLGLRGYLNMRIRKRNEKFMHGFADGIDMIVRGIRSGNPVNSALRIVAEHGEAPVCDEFKIVVDEVTYGRPLVDALSRMAKRVPEYDVSFFVVVLTVQQETGGNLAEVLGNLSRIIRKRQELFLKVRAITAEGRATAWILGGLPVVLAGVLYAMSPDYTGILFTHPTGQLILGAAIAFVVAGFFIIRKLAQIEV